MFDKLLIRLQANSRPGHEFSDLLRPFGWPYFPREVSEYRIDLTRASSSEFVLLKLIFLASAAVLTILCYLHFDIWVLFAIVWCLAIVIFPPGFAESIVVTPSGISLTDHLFLIRRIKTIPRGKICIVHVQHSTWGLLHIGHFSLTQADSKTIKLFSIYRKTHNALIEDSEDVIQRISAVLNIPRN